MATTDTKITNNIEAVIECRHLWKIFGNRFEEAMQAVRDKGLSKNEVRDHFDCVLGVQDASFNVGECEVFCIMGLSGSGKSTLIRMNNLQWMSLLMKLCWTILPDAREEYRQLTSLTGTTDCD